MGVTTRCVAAGALGRMCEQAFAHTGALSTVGAQDPDSKVQVVARDALNQIDGGSGISLTELGRSGAQMANAFAQQIELIRQRVGQERAEFEAQRRRDSSRFWCNVCARRARSSK